MNVQTPVIPIDKSHTFIKLNPERGVCLVIARDLDFFFG